MTKSSLSNWDGSLTAQKRPDTDHSPASGPNNTNAALQHGSFSRFHTPHIGVNGTFDAVNSVPRAVSVSGISEVQSKRHINVVPYSSRSPLTASSTSSSPHSLGYSPTARIDTPIYNSPVTSKNTVPHIHCGLLGVDNSKDNEEELVRLVEQTTPLSCATTSTAERVRSNSISRPSEEPNDAPIQMPDVSSAQSLFSTSPVSSHISPLFTPTPPPPLKRRRIFMSHVAVPPLPGHKNEYRTMMSSKHGLLDRKAKVKAAGLIQVFGGLRAAYEREEAMIEGESFSSSLRPSTTKLQRRRSYSSDDDIPLMVHRNSSRGAEPSSSPKKRRKPSVEASSPPPRKRSKDVVHVHAHQRTQSPAAVTEGSGTSVIRDSLPKNPIVKSHPSKQRKQSVGPPTPSVQAHTKSVVSRAKSVATSFCSDDEPAMTFSVYYDDTLEHVRLIDPREEIYEYTMQDEDPVSEEVLFMNLRSIRSRLKGHHVIEDMHWYDPQADVDVEPTETPAAPLVMSAKARGKQKAAPVSPAKDILLSPKYHIETNLGSDFLYLEGDHSVIYNPCVSQPRFGPTMHSPHVQHSPVDDSASVFCSSSLQEKEQLLGPLHNFFSLEDKAYPHDSNLDLSHFWLDSSESLHNGTIDPSLLGGFESMDRSSLSSSSSSSGSSLRDKSPSPPPKFQSPAVQNETESYPSSRLLSPPCLTVASYQTQLNDMLDELEMSDLTSLDDSSPYIDPISLSPPPVLSPPSPKRTAIPVKVGPHARGKKPQWPMAKESSFCHQCRTRSFRVSVECECRMIYCVRCIKTKYDNLEFDADAKDFVCPRCNNACTCDVCTRRRGEEYVSTRKQGRRALVSPSRSPRESRKSWNTRDAEKMDTEDHNPAPLHRLSPARHHHHLHVPLRELPHASPLGGRTNIPPLSERAKIATAYLPEDGSSNTLLVQRSRVFVGEIQPVWGLGTNPTLTVVDPVKKTVENDDIQMTRRRFVGQKAALLMPIRMIDSSGFMEYGSDADGEHDPEEPGDRLTPNDEHPGFEWRRGEDLDPDKISLGDEDVTSVVIMSLKQIGITAMVSTE
ncbi:hypothetical protein IW261DRAFT_1515531 [Armillaria novae-zelandiae]|uniref:Zinc-finger domain-containing protein n=1 Tax=Armillaria novae-zelandiae TaxID=153914 RepID=A0AA39NRZ4_9AGAR|nr:hypothetical protein IW261DRAFT_1515531 [Armillaria novae-zelandiae]